MSTIPLVERVASILDDPKPTETLIVSFLAENGPAKAPEISYATCVTNPYNQLPDLVDGGILTSRELEERGNPHEFSLSRETRTALDADPDWTREDLDRRVVRELASIHYCRDLSSAKAKQVAREIPGASSTAVAHSLNRLADRGVVERRSGRTTNYHLADVSEHTPYAVA